MRWFGAPLKTSSTKRSASHIRMAIQDRIRTGEDPTRARNAVLKEFGSVALKMETARGLGLAMAVEQDADRPAIRRPHAGQVVRDSRAAAILSLALGIGWPPTALLSVLHHVALRPLPFADPARLAMVWTIDPRVAGGGHLAGIVPPTGSDCGSRRTTATFGTGGISQPAGIPHGETTRPCSWSLHEVSAGLPAAARSAPRDGRFWSDAGAGRGPGGVISAPLWRQAFGGASRRDRAPHRGQPRNRTRCGRDARPVSQVLRSGRARCIRLSPKDSLWTPLPYPGPPQRNNRGNRGLRILGRVRSGLTVEAGAKDMAMVVDRLARTYPESKIAA